MLSSGRAAASVDPPRRRAGLLSTSTSTSMLAAPSARRSMPLRAASARLGASPSALTSSSRKQQTRGKTPGVDRARASPSNASETAATKAPTSSSSSSSSSDSANVGVVEGAPSPSPSTSSSKPFSWTSAWYPVAVESDLPRDRPVPIKLLGRRLVLWWAGEGASNDEGEEEEEEEEKGRRAGKKKSGRGGGGWSCLDDACSHRLAPLSEGRIDKACVPCTSGDGSESDGVNAKPCRALSCSYHGFAFDGAGAAVSVPQARHDGGAAAERRAARSPRARVRSHPTLALDQLVWVWADPRGGEQAAREAAEAPLPPGPPEEIRRLMLEAEAAEEEKGKEKGKSSSSSSSSSPPLVALITNQQYFRDLPVPYDEMMSNLADQSHVPFAHTGVASNRDSPFANHFTVSNVNAHLKEEEEAGNGDDYEGNDDDDASGTKRQQQDLRRRRFPGVAAADLVTFDLHWAPDALALAKQHVTIAPPCYIEYSTPLQSARDLEAAAATAAVREVGLRACLWFYATPLDENTTRIFNNAVVVAHGLPPWAARLVNARPKWVDHLFLQNVLDGDVAYLPQAAANEKLGLFSSSSAVGGRGGGGEEEEGEGGGEEARNTTSSSSLEDPRGELWAKRYFMPANADASVVAWRRWLHGERGRSGWLDAIVENGGGGGGSGSRGESFNDNNNKKGGSSTNSSSSSPIGSARVGGERFPALFSSSSSASSTASFAKKSGGVVPLPRSDLPRSELFDRWNQHTKNCPSCSRAMERARGVKKVLEVVALASGMFASSSALLLLLLMTSSSATATAAAATAAAAASSFSGEGTASALFDAGALLRVLFSSSALATLSLAGRGAAVTLESWFVFKDYEHWKS